jgi:hypothetical protein
MRLGPIPKLTAAPAAIGFEEQRRVRDVGGEPLRVGQMPGQHLLEVERLQLVHALEPDVLLRHRQLELLAQDLGVEQVLHADADARGLVRVGGADPAPGRPDLEPPEPPLARAVERHVPGHDQVRVPGQEHHALGLVAARLEVVQLGDQNLGIDHTARPDRAPLPGDDAGWDLPDPVRLPAGHDRVARVRAALVAADEVRLLRQQIDDLALALVSPLRADDHGRGHAPQCRRRSRRPARASSARPRRPRGGPPTPRQTGARTRPAALSPPPGSAGRQPTRAREAPGREAERPPRCAATPEPGRRTSRSGAGRRA